MHSSQITVLLNEDDQNRDTTHTFMTYAGEACSIPGFFIPKPFRLFKAIHCNEYRIISDEPRPKTLFYIKLFDLDPTKEFMLKRISSLSKKITQCLVWSSLVPGHRDAFHFLATRFFEHFLDSFNIAITPGPMTLCGAHFWEGRLLTSFTQSDVSVFSLKDTEGESSIEEIPNWIDFQIEWSEFIYKSCEGINDDSVILISKARPDYSERFLIG
ncbi:hypothetical protein F3J37_01010 [Pantoea sp. Al-1710]|uniref:Uncharacterized protein n=1 Tax=Candidatus Pantoea communis TaxID=2608354 RepID=A0ABX0RHY8_9GAMM|nr:MULTISPECIES: hypothetical protein [Pantoea]NIG13044.1 hypothetical protein [Pantoea sp. Cy-640]NIG17255.1 hypothetical protein [Pantoea communis]